MIIDFHTHVFPAKIAPATINKLETMAHVTAFGDGTIESLLDSMQKSKIDLSVVLPVVTNPKQFQKINETAVLLNETYPDKICSFGGIHPDSTDYKSELNTIKAMGFKGIKLHPDYQDTYFNDIKYKRIVSYATELDLNITVHAGYDIGYGNPIHCTPQMSAEVIRDTSPNRLILAHTGGFNQWDDVEQYIVGSNVYLDLSYTLGMISLEQLSRIIYHHGADKILFATDYPWGSQSSTLSLLSSLPIETEDRKLLLEKNARKLLNI